MRNVFIHIGIGKTATTTLQVESFPRIARFKGLTFLTLQDLLKKYRIERTNYKIHPLEGVEYKLKDLNNVIISCESFVGRDFNPYYFKNAMEINKKIFGNDVTIIITIRKPSDLFTSNYIQKIQEGSTCKVKEFFSKDLHPEKYQISNNFYAKLISMYKENFDRVLIVKFDEIKKFNFLDTLIDLDSTQKKLLSTSFAKKIYNKSYSKFALNLSLIISKVSSIISIKQPKIKLPRKKNVDKKSIGPLLNFYNRILNFFSVRKILHSLDKIIPYKKYQINFHEIGFPEIDQINQKYEEYDDIQLYNGIEKADVKSKYSSDVKEVILTENSEPKLKIKDYYKKTLFILKGTNFKLLPIFTIILFAGFIDLISIGMIGPLIGSVANPNFIEDSNLPFNIDLVEYSLENVQTYLFIIISSLFIFRGIVSMYLNFKIVQFSYKQDVILKNKLMKNYINMPLSKFTKRNRSEYLHSINYLSSQFTSQIIMSILQTVSSVIIGLMLLILLAATNLKLLLIAATLFIFIIIAYDLLIKQRLKQIGILFNLFSTRMYKAMNEGLDGFKEIRIYRKESYFLDLFKKSSERSAKYQILNNAFSLLPRYMFESFIILLGVLSVY